jgi:hypothetical protein
MDEKRWKTNRNLDMPPLWEQAQTSTLWGFSFKTLSTWREIHLSTYRLNPVHNLHYLLKFVRKETSPWTAPTAQNFIMKPMSSISSRSVTYSVEFYDARWTTIGKDLEENGSALCPGTISAFVWRDRGEPRKRQSESRCPGRDSKRSPSWIRAIYSLPIILTFDTMPVHNSDIKYTIRRTHIKQKSLFTLLSFPLHSLHVQIISWTFYFQTLQT